MQAIDPDELWTPKRLADYLFKTEAALAQMRHRGDGPKFIKANGRILYRLSDIRAWLDANTAQSTSDVNTETIRA